MMTPAVTTLNLNNFAWRYEHRTMNYKNDVMVGTWAMIVLVALSGLGTIVYFDHITSEFEQSVSKCEDCF